MELQGSKATYDRLIRKNESKVMSVQEGMGKTSDSARSVTCRRCQVGGTGPASATKSLRDEHVPDDQTGPQASSRSRSA